MCIRQSADSAIAISLQGSILSFYREADWNSEWSNNIPVVMRLETGTSSASLKTPGLRGKSNMNSAFLPSFQGQDRTKGTGMTAAPTQQCHLPHSGWQHWQLPWIPVTEFSQQSPWASHTQSSSCSLYCKNLSTHQKFSHHLCAYTLIHKYCKVQQHPTAFQPTHLPTLQRLES